MRNMKPSTGWSPPAEMDQRILAERQFADLKALSPGTCFADPDFALSLEEAYALQDAVKELRLAAGETVAGYKIGCTGASVRAQFGMDGPIRAILFAGEVKRSGAELDHRAYAHLAVEAEMLLRLDDHGAIAAAYPVIELHHFVFRAAKKTLAELIANNGLNAGLVLPPDECDHRQGRLGLMINGTMVEEGSLWPMAGGAQASLAWLRQHAAIHGLSLQPGQLVLAGTPLGLYPVSPGDDIATCIDGKAITRCTIT